MTKTENEIIAEFMATDAINSPHRIPSKILAYDTSWDWLMPVVEKIKQIHPKGVNVFKHHNFWELPITASRQEVYNGVLNYIKWYNSNPTSS